jgi:hypothetical protein
VVDVEIRLDVAVSLQVLAATEKPHVERKEANAITIMEHIPNLRQRPVDEAVPQMLASQPQSSDELFEGFVTIVLDAEYGVFAGAASFHQISQDSVEVNLNHLDEMLPVEWDKPLSFQKKGAGEFKLPLRMRR